MTGAISLRHVLATLVYRGAKALRDAPEGFSGFRAAADSRSAGEILAHIGDLLDWALTQAAGREAWHNAPVNSWEDDSRRFFASAAALDELLASDAPLHREPERIFQGALADSLTHVGQIALLRRLAGARVKGENYSRAGIEAGQVGASQPPAVYEFD